MSGPGDGARGGAGDGVVEVAAIVGSLRQGSYNRGLLRAALGVQPAAMRIIDLAIADLPPYDGDVEAAGDPEPVRALKAGIARADALLIVTPEYNWSLPGVLKNALDWASRGDGRAGLRAKPAAVMGAAAGPYGTVRAQLHLRQIAVTLGLRVLEAPQLMVADAGAKFDPAGELTDPETRERVRDLLDALLAYTLQLRAGSAALAAAGPVGARA